MICTFFFTLFFLLRSLDAAIIRDNASFSTYQNFCKNQCFRGVLIQSIVTTQNGNASTMSCSGVMLDPWTILTAGHCVSDESTGDQFTGVNYYIFNPQASFIVAAPTSTLQNVIRHPDFKMQSTASGNTTLNEYDAALILLTDPIYKTNYATLSKIGPKVGDLVSGFGFGGDEGTYP